MKKILKSKILSTFLVFCMVLGNVQGIFFNNVANAATNDYSLSIKVDKQSPQPVNNKITITADAGGTTNLLYKFWISDGVAWKLVQDYSEDNTYDWVPKASGDYTIWIDVKDKASTRQADKYITMKFKINSVEVKSLTTDKISPQRVNTPVKITAGSTGCITPMYKFWVFQNGAWKVLQEYSTSNTYTWTPSSIGDYKIWVDVKDKDSTVPSCAYKEISYSIKDIAVVTGLTFDKVSPQPVNNKIQITANAVSTNGVLYKFWVLDEGVWKVIQDYSDKNTCSWTPSKAGTYNIWVDVKDINSKRASDSYYNVDYKINSVQVTSLATDKASPQRTNTPIKITAGSTGCITPMYKFWVFQNGAWKVLQEYSTSNTYTWTPSSIGDYKIWVDVKDKDSTVPSCAYKEISYSIQDTALITGLTFDKVSPQPVNNKIQITAEATGVNGVLYKFWVLDEGVWKVIQDYSDKNTCSWTPSKAGTYNIWVDVKDINSKRTSDSYYNVDYKINSVQVTSLTTDKASPQRTNTPIKITAESAGCITPMYKFWVFQNGALKVLQEYSASNTYTWTPTSTGNYKIWVDVKDKDSTVPSCAYKEIPYSIEDIALITGLTFDKVSPQPVNNKIQITANAVASNSILYKFWVLDEGVWKVIQDYSDKNTCSWTPKKAGTYNIWVDVKDVNSKRTSDSYYNVDYKINSVQVTSLTTDKASPQRTNTPIKITAESAGCITPMYKFWVFQNGAWKVLQEYSASNTYTWTPTGTGNYKIWVDVKDKDSTVPSCAYKEIPYSIEQLALITGVTFDKQSPQLTNNKIQITAQADGANAILYRFWICYEGVWKVIQDYSGNNTCSWIPTKAGDYKIWVDVKDVNSKNDSDSHYIVDYKIDGLKVESLTTDKASPQEAFTQINITANATGSANILYKFWIHDGISWKVVQDYSTSNTYRWEPISEGEYKIWVDIKDVNSSAISDASKDINYSIRLKKGNLPSNITNIGFTATDGNYIYYTSSIDGTLTRQYIYGTEKITLSSDVPSFINVVDGWVYYRNDSDYGSLYKIKNDGTSRTKLVQGNITYVFVLGKWIYYCENIGTGTNLCRISIDGGASERIATLTKNNIAVDVIIENGYVYYTELTVHNIWKIKLDGTDSKLLTSDFSSSLVKSGSWIYYANDNDEGKIYKVNIDATSKAKVSDDTPVSMNIYEGWIYYSHYVVYDDGTEGWLISKMRPDGSGTVDLIDDLAMIMNISNGWIYYFNPNDSTIYKVRTDGSGYGTLD